MGGSVIDIDNLFDNNAWWGNDSTTTTCSTLDAELLNGPPIIKVWKGNFFPVTTEYPQFHKNSMMSKDKAYIVAGVGIVCGEDAYEYIWKQGSLAVWTDEPPD